MSEQQKTDTELLQSSPWVDSTLFPKALNNRLAQDYGKCEMKRKIANMETEYSLYITWSTHSTPPSDSTSQWGHSIKIVGDPQKSSGSEAKS